MLSEVARNQAQAALYQAQAEAIPVKTQAEVETAQADVIAKGLADAALPPLLAGWIVAVLLIIAVTYERRAGGERGVVARLRDLA